jgi:hypothetical protein
MFKLEKLEGLKDRFEEVREYASVAIAVVTIAVFIKKRMPSSNIVQENSE